jgi:anti-sigma B factor antagonist
VRSSEAFGMERHREGARQTLILRGELDFASAPILEATVRRLCERGTRQLVFDLGALEFIDSGGLNAILRSTAVCEAHLCELSITPAQPHVSRVFELTRLLDRLPFRWPTQAAAAEPMQEPRALPHSPRAA